jgi:hypothetical protein
MQMTVVETRHHICEVVKILIILSIVGVDTWEVGRDQI